MKIALLTWTYFNYGTQLQAYSMCTYLQNNGQDVDFINYLTRKEDVIRYGKKNLSHQIKRVIKKSKQISLNRRMAKIGDDNIEALKNRQYKFDTFMKNSLPLTKKYTASELLNISDCYDLYIVGSDQVWSPKYLDGRFFLDFVKNKNKLVAYAPSFGVKSLDPEITERVSKWIQRFEYLSVREIAGKEIIQELTGKEVPVVLDPTFLFNKDEWYSNFEASNQQDEKYILCYFLSENSYYWKVVSKIADILGFKVIIDPNTPDDFECPYEKYIDVAPSDFAKMIYDAAYVITDSFHGTAFAINFGIDFLTLARFSEKSKESENSRVKSILELLNFDDRFIVSDIISCTVEIDKEKWKKCEMLLEKKREESKQYLDNILKV